MIPFARIMLYGNTPPIPKSILLSTSEYSETYSLIYNEKLYLSGSNANGQLGTGNNTNSFNEWIMVPEVDEVRLCSTGFSQTIYITSTGKVMLTGHNVLKSSVTVSNTWIDVTSSFVGIDINEIKYINIDRNGLMLIHNDGSVWGIGTDTEGWSGQGKANVGFFSLKKLFNSSNAVACMSGTGAARIILEDGTVLSSGRNTQNQCNASSVSNVLTFTESFPGVDVQKINQIKMCNNNCIIFLSDGTYYGTGWGSYGSLGNGNTNSGFYGFVSGTLPILPANFRSYFKFINTSSGSVSYYMTVDNEIYGCGHRSKNYVNSTVDIGTFEKCAQNEKYDGLMLMSGSGNIVLFNPSSSFPNIATSSPKNTAPTIQSNVPTYGIGSVLPLVLPM
ncbi:BNR repeat domain protein [Salmonella phage SE_PL]|uniref:hypothetical protein n=1 Tax=Salmonella enterica TaxID=28901 RepID=UPI000FDF7525|nr:DNA condensation protein [Salmonella phage Munch]EAZ2022802.1 hypothetical protein [Salmonella enterica]ECV9083936.1 hypothetical protein [Salmonella enterica subsp. enterica serovar Infantis]MCP0435462.1 hypothetical protein [Salmonella enterica subsp. enterica serovar Mbandaka]QCW18650.1 DNA condansation protein [Salmonella phage 7t3]QIG63039.1 BNR repeat domain protein [Salmonella phage SE_PL]WNV47621.1 hypothetical protein [Klebsiella phage fENko-Kae01]